MKKYIRVTGIVVLLGILTLTGCKSAKKTENTAKKTEEVLAQEPNTVRYAEGETCSYDIAQKENVKEMSVEDINALNSGNCRIIKDSKGEIQYIGGRYTDCSVRNWQEAYNSLCAVSNLVNLDMKKYSPLKTYVWDNKTTVYTFVETTVEGIQESKVIHVLADSKGKVIALTLNQTDIDDYAKYCTGKKNYSSDTFFEYMEPVTAQAVDVSGNTVEVPAMYNTRSNQYFLGDLDRKIIIGNFEENLSVLSALPFIKSTDNTWNDPQGVTALKNMVEIYDYYYDKYGWKSADGCGIPLMVYVHRKDRNADYDGLKNDFAWINASDEYVNNKMVLAHEYTHGIFGDNGTGNMYQNESGAINEGYAYLMGNIIQMLQNSSAGWMDSLCSLWGEKDFDALCEHRTNTYGDTKYMAPTSEMNLMDDFGGVHYNSALLLQASTDMYRNYGMSLEEMSDLFYYSMSFLVPNVTYEMMEENLLLTAKQIGLEKYVPAIEESLQKVGIYPGMDKNLWLAGTQEGMGRISIPCTKPDAQYYAATIIDGEGKGHLASYNETGGFTKLVKPGKIKFIISKYDEKKQDISIAYESEEIEVKEGETVTLDAITLT